jgi:hypothetical protein
VGTNFEEGRLAVGSLMRVGHSLVSLVVVLLLLLLLGSVFELLLLQLLLRK